MTTLRELLEQHGVDVDRLLDGVAIGEGEQPCGPDVEAAITGRFHVGGGEPRELVLELELFDWRKINEGGAR